MRLTAELIGDTLLDTIANWRKAVKSRSQTRPAGTVYTGRSAVESRRAVQSAGGILYFVSAGMGLINASDEIPAYNLTPVQVDGDLAAVFTKHRVGPVEWWNALTENGISRLIREWPTEKILVALPATYLRMLNFDLIQCQQSDVSRIRIFTSQAGKLATPDFLRHCVMPYDERIETMREFCGTRADFPQRAMRHFIEVLKGQSQDLDEGRNRVVEALSTCGWRKTPKRRRLEDAEIKVLINAHWKDCQGRNSLLLRALRDDELVACEQSRFNQLWREVKSDLHRGVEART